MSFVRRYTFKAYPTATQARTLHDWRLRCGWLWNGLVETHNSRWEKTGKRPTAFALSKEITELRAAMPDDWADIPSSVLARVAVRLDDGWKTYFSHRKAGNRDARPPDFAPSAMNESVPFRIDGKNGRLDRREGTRTWHLRLAKIGAVKLRGDMPKGTDITKLGTCEMIYRDGCWWASLAVHVERDRPAGAAPVTVHFDLIDRLCRLEIGGGNAVDGAIRPPREAGFSDRSDANTLDKSAGCGGSPDGTAGLEGDRKVKYPRRVLSVPDGTAGLEGDRKHLNQIERAIATRILAEIEYDGAKAMRDRRLQGPVKGKSRASNRWKRETARIGRRRAAAIAAYKMALHGFARDLVAQASEITLIVPPIRDATRSAKGDERHHGAAVRDVAAINRTILQQSPASLIQMIEYRAKEAGIACTVLRAPEAEAATIGRDISTATKAARRLKRNAKPKKAAA